MTEFTPEHLQLVEQVTQYVNQWRPKMPWLENWSVRVIPIEDDGRDDGTMEIDSAGYIKTAIIRVMPTAGDPDEYLLGEGTVELKTIHELCHLLFEPLRIVVYHWTSDTKGDMPIPAHLNMQDAEETAVWHLARMLHRGLS